MSVHTKPLISAELRRIFVIIASVQLIFFHCEIFIVLFFGSLISPSPLYRNQIPFTISYRALNLDLRNCANIWVHHYMASSVVNSHCIVSPSHILITIWVDVIESMCCWSNSPNIWLLLGQGNVNIDLVKATTDRDSCGWNIMDTIVYACVY